MKTKNSTRRAVFSLHEPTSSGGERKIAVKPIFDPSAEIDTDKLKDQTGTRRVRPPSGQSPASINNIFGHVPINLRASTGLPFFGAESQQWMESCTGQKIDFDRLNLASVRTQDQIVHDFASLKKHFRHHTHPDLPERSIVRSALHKFISSSAHRRFPFVHPGLFHYTIETAYDNQLSEFSPDIPSARACIFAFISFSSFMVEGNSLGNSIESQRYIHEAQYLASAILDGQATLDGIQALLMVVSQPIWFSFFN